MARTPQGSPRDPRRRLMQTKALKHAPALLLPITVMLFAVLVTGTIVLWGLTAYSGREEHATQRKAPASADAGTASASTTNLSADPAAAGSGAGSQENSSSGAVGALANPAPFLSDLLPQSTGSEGQQKKPLTPEEEELSKAEAVYKSNMIRRNELMQGQRPPYPYKRWNAGRIREVFLNAPYPCPHPMRLGTAERGKWLCNVDKLRDRPVIMYSIGSLEDLSFEEAVFKELGPKTLVHAFTPYLSEEDEKSLMSSKSKSREFLASYHPIGIASKDNVASAKSSSSIPGKEYMTFTELLQKMEHSRIDILKLDCEGCETTVLYELSQWYKKDEAPFTQVIVEIHHARQPKKTLPVLFSLEDMGFRLFNVQQEHKSTQRYELSFVHERFLFPSKDLMISSQNN